ncbi:transcription initiation factor TFIIE [Penicillium riverlandense]|uniref:transcription initiation factor TFIIE n=1 Tax=Penicillium riverlandense TaxID=1903569 RepID=UPI002546CB4B|nr:transcription initiation factor TFIIE [Penicillium riverlandense]KAJ5814641.1 transcription initiation factor TFIIE [Penicillium riverlandense]
MSYLQNKLKSFNASVMESANRMPQQRRGVTNASASSSQVPSSAPTPSSSGEAKKKRHDVDIVYSQPANTGTGRDIMTQVLFAIEHMKTKGVPLKFDNIVSYLSLQHRENDPGYMRALRSILQMHEKVNFDPSGANGEGTFSFRPPHNIRTPEQLLQHLQAQTTAAGMSVRDLREGWPNVEEAINQMEKEGKLLVTRNKKDDHAKMVWANDPSLMEHFDDEFKQIWEKIKVPGAQDVKEELERAGITPTNKNKVIKARPKVEQKKTKKPRRSGKTTNTHMMGILRDYSHLKR